MQLISSLLLALGAASFARAAPAPEAAANAEAAFDLAVKDAAPLEKRAEVATVLWRDINWHGEYLNLVDTNGGCANIPFSFNDAASSLVVAKKFYCTFYADAGCKGGSKQFGGPYPGSISNLGSYGFNDVISSYLCYVYGGA